MATLSEKLNQYQSTELNDTAHARSTVVPNSGLVIHIHGLRTFRFNTAPQKGGEIVQAFNAVLKLIKQKCILLFFPFDVLFRMIWNAMILRLIDCLKTISLISFDHFTAY